MAGWVLWLAGAVVALLALFLLLLAFPVRVELEYHRRPGDWGRGVIVLRLIGGLLQLRRSISLGDQVETTLRRHVEAGRRPAAEQLPRRSSLLRFARLAAGPVLATIDVTRADLTLEVATGDAARTALATGALWSLLGGGFAFALSHLRHRPRRPRLTIRPNFNFQGWQLSIDLLCIIEARPGHIIVALLAVAGKLAIKGGMRRGRPSDSRADENGHGEHQGHG